MSYLSGDEKREFREAKRFFGWEGTKLLILMLVLTFVIGAVGVGYKLTIGKAHVDASREVFEHNKSYVHGMVEDLAKYKLQLEMKTDPVERRAIVSFITENYANFDGKLIESDTLRSFYYDVMEGRVK